MPRYKISIAIEFRRACGDDASQLTKLCQQLVDQPDIRVSREVRAELEHDPTNIVIVATSEAQLVATAFLVNCRDVMCGNQPFALVENVVVDADARRSTVPRYEFPYDP